MHKDFSFFLESKCNPFDLDSRGSVKSLCKRSLDQIYVEGNMTMVGIPYPVRPLSNTFVICWPCLPRQGYCVYRFIIEYSSLRDFGPLGNRSIFI
jgi:hypothetical protein